MSSIVQRDPGDQVQVLDDEGNVLEDAEEPDISDEELLEMYSQMKLSRHFDERAVSLQRQGRMGTYPPLSGQEGAQIGSVHALDDGDWLVPSYREHGATMAFGLEPYRILRYWMGDEEGNKIPEDTNIFTVSVPIATQIPHSTGLSWASKLKGEDRAFLCYFGDGATSEGDFHEGMNFAGVFDTPTVFFCNNNQWAISVPREKQTASETIAQKATAYGFEGVQVDGMDPLAVYKVTKEAVDKAKNPGDSLRPTLIEAVQYRYGAHTTADDPSKYRDEEEVERWKQKDPIERMEGYLRNKGLLDDDAKDDIENKVKDIMSDAVDKAESAEDPDTDVMFENVYEEMTWNIREHKEWLDELKEKHGDETLLEE